MNTKMIIAIVVIAVAVVVAFLVSRNAAGNRTETGTSEMNEGNKNTSEYTSITMAQAKEIFQEEGSTSEDYIILDVRRADEFANGHIPGAINVANESIGTEPPAELPDKDQTIYVYCRSGNRSKQASKKLAAMGYTNIIEFGGIMDWTGEVVK